MAEKVPMTALSPTMEDGTIIGWSVKEGDTISAGDVLCEVETDKASMEYEATQEGVLLRIVVGQGGHATVGQTIAILGSAGEDITAVEAEIAGESISTAPVSPEPPPPTEDSAPSTPPRLDEPVTAPVATEVSPVPLSSGRAIKASPLAVKIASERNINLALINGSGPGGRIIKRDVEGFRGVPGGAASVSAASPGTAPALTDEEIPVAGKRAVIARRLSESKFSAPHYYLKNSVSMEALVAARKMLNDSLDYKVSLNAFFLKFAAEALKRHPGVNASWQGDKIVRFGSVDIGLAVDVGNGLITPVVRNCGNKGVIEIDGELQELIGKAREGKLKPEEYGGASFSVSNLGSFGVEEFTAIINPPGSAILALGATKKMAVVGVDGSIGVGSVMKMTLSCDHRVIDGAEGGRFLSELQRLMESPVRLIF